MEGEATGGAAFASAHGERAGSQVEIAHLDIGGLLGTETCIDQEGEEGLVTAAHGDIPLGVGRAEQGIDAAIRDSLGSRCRGRQIGNRHHGIATGSAATTCCMLALSTARSRSAVGAVKRR